MIFHSDNTGLSNKQGGADNTPLQGRKNLIWDMRVLNMWHGTASTLSPINLDAFNSDNMDLMHSVDIFKTVATGIAKIPESDYKYAWKCKDCIPFHDNILDGHNQWESLKTKGGINHIESSTRLFATHVITQDQIALQSGDSDTITGILPRHTWDSTFWETSNYSSYFNGLAYTPGTSEFTSHVSITAIGWGTGYIQKGRYAMFFVDRNSLAGDPSLNPSKRNSLSGSVDGPSNIAAFLTSYSDLPDSIPGHPENSAYLHDVYSDPQKRTNLFKYSPTSIPTPAKTAAYDMIKFYLYEQDRTNSTIDTKLLYKWCSDPALIERAKVALVKTHYCDISIMCKHDMPITRSNGPLNVTGSVPIPPPYNFYRLTNAPTIEPTSSPTPPTNFPTESPITMSPTHNPTPNPTTANPTSSPTNPPPTPNLTSSSTETRQAAVVAASAVAVLVVGVGGTFAYGAFGTGVVATAITQVFPFIGSSASYASVAPQVHQIASIASMTPQTPPGIGF